MRRAVVCVLLVLALAHLAGCGNVSLKGEALTAAETSAMDAYQAAQRVQAEPSAPSWVRVYLAENYKQWRFFVQSAHKDLTWGPELKPQPAAQPLVSVSPTCVDGVCPVSGGVNHE